MLYRNLSKILQNKALAYQSSSCHVMAVSFVHSADRCISPPPPPPPPSFFIHPYSSYICHTIPRKTPRLTRSPLSYRIPSPFFGSPLPFSNFSILPFLEIFGKVNPPFNILLQISLSLKIMFDKDSSVKFLISR